MDPWHFGTDLDPRIRASDQMDPSPGPDPAIYVFDLQGSNKKLPIFSKFSIYYFSEVPCITSFLKDKKSQNSTILAFKTLPPAYSIGYPLLRWCM